MTSPSMVSRRGMALVLVIGIMTLLLALATSLTDLTVSSMNQSSQRQSTAMLATGTESLANLGLAYLQQRTDLEALLASMRTAGPQELIYGFTTGGDRYTVNTTLAESASQTLGGRPALNGIDPALNWTYVSTVNVEVFGTRTAMDLFRLRACEETSSDLAEEVSS